MLLSLSITNFTLVEHLEIDFTAGMTAITGETGAGKSLILDALGMALGDRADTNLIRQGAERLEIAASFDLGNNPQPREWLQQQDLLQEDLQSECLLRRTLSREGRSRGFINGSPATMQQLQALGDMLVDIHSQHEHQSLLRRDTHRTLLDNFAGAQHLAETVSTCFNAWRKITEQLRTLSSQSAELQAKRELLSFQVEELDRLAMQPEELTQLEEEQRVLANAESILRDSHALLALCQGEAEFNLQQGMNQALQLLHRMPSKPEALTNAEAMLTSANIELSEASSEIQHYLDSFEADPERLAYVDERLGTIYELARKHRVPPAELHEHHQTLQLQFEQLAGGDQSIEQLTQQAEKLAADYLEQAKKLTETRAKAATRFAESVNQQLARLAMQGAALEVALTPNKTDKFSANGLEMVELRVATNPGQPAGPLAKIASGGELSRISLAIQVIAAQHSAIPTLLFDEVDVGIGGATAEVVGRLLRKLGERGQVICITHQPQVASCAHRHLLASKLSSEKRVESSLTTLDDRQRTEEIARMLGGAKITEKTLDHAREMVETGSALET